MPLDTTSSTEGVDTTEDTEGTDDEIGESTDTDTDAGESTDTDTGTDTGRNPLGGCWDEAWAGDELPVIFFGDTSELLDDAVGSCGDDSTPDYSLRFTAPWTGSFEFDTTGSEFDTVVYINEGGCEGSELACNDNFLVLESRVLIDLEEGQTVTATVDGADAFSLGNFTLTVDVAPDPECETTMLTPPLPLLFQGDTTELEDQLASACGGAGAPEALFRFIPPGPGTYRVDTSGSSFDTVLYILDACDEAPLACNDDNDLDLQSELILELNPSDKPTIVVDGRGPGDFGAFLLNIEEI
ncbi:hypothetical protein [Pseudenhygromyxa sp. WMMC2535]|uniref:hypothetical protein n=1 Tax=Pseudenhygromyxa sp. WMMC2535 TaxID=2712867 RepID=UPI0031F8AD61